MVLPICRSLKFLEGIAVFDSNGVLMVDVFVNPVARVGHDAGDLREKTVVFRRHGIGERAANSKDDANLTRRTAAWISSRRLFHPGSVLRYFSD